MPIWHKDYTEAGSFSNSRYRRRSENPVEVALSSGKCTFIREICISLVRVSPSLYQDEKNNSTSLELHPWGSHQLKSAEDPAYCVFPGRLP